MKEKIKAKSLIVSVVFIAVIVTITSMPLGGLPPLQNLLNPNSGVFDPVPPNGATGVHYMNISVNGTSGEVITYVQPDGFIGIESNNTCLMYYMQGYMEAQYRLEEMDFIKRTALGTLSQVVGSSVLPSDIFYRTLQDYQIASQEASNLSPGSYTHRVLENFTMGINAYIATLTPSTMPLLFKLLDYTPHAWNITDVMAVQQFFLWQNSAGGSSPLYFNYALQQMPTSVVKLLYPAYPAGVQNPIVPNCANPSIYNETGNKANLSLYTPSYKYNGTGIINANPQVSSQVSFSNVNSVDGAVFQKFFGTGFSSSFQYAAYKDFGSNNWAVNGFRTHNTSALLANDPHLTTEVPSIWLGFQLVSPVQNVVGVVFPGFPGIVLGHNPKVAWGATNGQVQQIYYYAETMKSGSSTQYLNNGSYSSFSVINENISVAGGSTYQLKVMRAVNGVILYTGENTIAMDWTGLMPSYEISFFLHIDKTSSVNEFRQNVTKYFKTAIQNWAVADSQGNIGIFPYGDYPIVSQGNPRGILPGTGPYNWQGFIPVNNLPYLYNPARGFVVSANQITVSSNYPYYIGWDYEAGYRADQIHSMLNSSSGMNTTGMEKIQLSVHDYTTNVFLKPLLGNISSSANSSVINQLTAWNGSFTINSIASTIYHYWLKNFLNDTFLPYLQKYNITRSEGLFNNSFFLGSDSYYHGPLITDLVNWTTQNTPVTWFSNPLTGQSRTEGMVMNLAMNQTISYLDKTYGPMSTSWNWGNIHKRVLSSLFGVSALNTTIIPAAGDGNTPNAAYGTISNFGPSWRMVVNMSEPVKGVGIYPGGLSENPLSPFYSNTFQDWNNGIYYTLIPDTAPAQFFYMYGGAAL